MYSIWIWNHFKAFKYSDCSIEELFKTLCRMDAPKHTIEVTPINGAPSRKTLFVCPVTKCADCPKAIQGQCPLYKIFKQNARLPKQNTPVIDYSFQNSAQAIAKSKELVANSKQRVARTKIQK